MASFHLEVQYDDIVVDAGAIIKGHGYDFHHYGTNFWTVEECLDEIRDNKSRHLLETLPFVMRIRTPSTEAMRAVGTFARQTGDFNALSLTDLKLIALTYDIESEKFGTKHLRKAPKRSVQQLQALNDKQKKDSTGTTTTITTTSGHRSGNDVVQDASNAMCNITISPQIKQEQQETEAKELKVENKAVNDGDIQEEVEINEDDNDAGFDNECFSDGDEYNSDSSLDSEEQNPKEFNLVQENFPSLGQASVDATVDFEKVVNDSAVTNTAAASTTTTIETYVDDTKVQVEVDNNNQVPTSSWSSVLAKSANKPVTRTIPKMGRTVGSTAALTAKANGTENPFKSPTSGNNNYEQDSIKSRSLNVESRILRTNAAMEGGTFDDDGVGWINPSNIKESRVNGSGMFGGHLRGSKKDDKSTKNKKVVCLTNDFSMQNTIMQMNLNAISLDGMLIKQVKQWVLHCNGCFNVSYDLSKIFCPKCGVNHLSRVAASIDSRNGKLKLHLKKDYKFNLSGTKYSLPKPGKQGRYDGELLLREDQLLEGAWKQKARKSNKDVRNAFGDDLGVDLGLHFNKAPGNSLRVGLGVRNPNAAKGRERRGKKKKSSK